MTTRYNADEVFEMAEQIERNGARFYRRAADLACAGEARGMFLELAAMEDDHEKTFAAMRADLSEGERKPMVFDPDDELALYLRAIADRRVFDVKADPSKRLKGQESVADILHMAIGLEKDSIVFYLGMREVVPEGLGRKRLDGIIQQEYGHIATLSAKLPE